MIHRYISVTGMCFLCSFLTPASFLIKKPLVFPAFPNSGRIAGVDFGTVRIGTAHCDPDRRLVSPLEVRQVTTPDSDAKYFSELATLERIGGWVVGLPLHMDGKESQRSEQARDFAVWLRDETQLPLRMFDERLTTVDADARAAAFGWSREMRKSKIDALAALVLLESFLESWRHFGEMPGCDP
ncbi:MAG: Holliday junction resolvase RuvX [Planctomycetota bacterium]